jgi:signal transduction histidine kinase
MMITSYASIDLAVKATNNAAYNFLPKPFTQQDIKTAIESITKHLFLKRMTQQMNEDAKKIRFKFLSVLAHELKSPINAVEGYLQIIKDRQLGNEIAAYDQMVERSLERIRAMRSLIMDMLDLTRIESGARTRNIANTDIIQIAQMCIDGVLPLANQKNVRINKQFPENLIAKVDPLEIEMIFNNLISNAVKYNREKGIVDFIIKNDDEKMIFVVKDTGIGMNEEEKANLFQEFMRAKNDKTRKISGTGLGLSIMKKVIELYHGTIDVESQPDVGTTFTVVMPFYK